MVDRGSIRLYDAVQPALDAGLYRFGVSITGSAQTDWIAAERFVSVEAPRYRIEETDLFAAYPMPGSRSEVTGQIPWVALRRRTLPWERRGPVEDQSVPWLALVVTSDAEAAMVSAPGLGSLIGPTAAGRFGPPPAGPFAGLAFPSTAALLALAPTAADARLLCHVREVSLTDTEFGSDEDDGWVAVVVANRVLPGAGEQTWRATLVSLEHRDDVAAGRPETPALLALATWTFTDVAGLSFQQTLAGLDVGLFGAPPPGEAAGTLLDHSDRAGAVAPSRYRSPLVAPASGPGEPDSGGPGSGGPVDVTLTAAHQLGRLLAAADGRVVAELVRLRQATLARTARSVTRRFAGAGDSATPVALAVRHLIRRAEDAGRTGSGLRAARPTRVAAERPGTPLAPGTPRGRVAPVPDAPEVPR